MLLKLEIHFEFKNSKWIHKGHRGIENEFPAKKGGQEFKMDSHRDFKFDSQIACNQKEFSAGIPNELLDRQIS